MKWSPPPIVSWQITPSKTTGVPGWAGARLFSLEDCVDFRPDCTPLTELSFTNDRLPDTDATFEWKQTIRLSVDNNYKATKYCIYPILKPASEKKHTFQCRSWLQIIFCKNSAAISNLAPPAWNSINCKKWCKLLNVLSVRWYIKFYIFFILLLHDLGGTLG